VPARRWPPASAATASLVAVVTVNNDLVAIASGGKVLAKQRLTAQSYTAPLVAGRRVFVQAADRSHQRLRRQSGRRLWAQQRPPKPLVLKPDRAC
jgi:outer membrane protein assembly factor BamB